MWLPTGAYQHPFYYYFRNAGWDLHEEWHDEGLIETLDIQGAQRAVLMQCGAKVFRVNEAMRRVFAAPFRSPWIFDVEILARYLSLPVDDGGTPRRSRIYELTVPAWYDVPGSKLEASAFVRSMFELVAIWRDRRAGRI